MSDMRAHAREFFEPGLGVGRPFSKVGNLMGQMAGMGLSTAEAQTLSNQLGAIAARLRNLMND